MSEQVSPFEGMTFQQKVRGYAEALEGIERTREALKLSREQTKLLRAQLTAYQTQARLFEQEDKKLALAIINSKELDEYDSNR